MAKWTEEQLDILKQEYEKNTPIAEIAKILERSVTAVKSQASLRGFKSSKTWKPWTLEDIEFLECNKALGRSLSDIAKDLGRSLNSVKAQSAKGTKINNKKNLYKNKDLSQPAKVYLVYFPGEGFYKVGVTVQDIDTRLQGFPKYEIVQILETSLGEALELEDGVLELYKKGFVSTSNDRLLRHGGLSECFYSEESPLIL